MKLSQIAEILNANILCGTDCLEKSVGSAVASDMMSDVLAYVKDQGVLITGLINPQVIRTASMMDMVCIVFVRSKAPTEEMIDLADTCGIVLMKSDMRAFEACGHLYTSGLRGNAGKGHE